MKRINRLLVIVALGFSITACGNTNNSDESEVNSVANSKGDNNQAVKQDTITCPNNYTSGTLLDGWGDGWGSCVADDMLGFILVNDLEYGPVFYDDYYIKPGQNPCEWKVGDKVCVKIDTTWDDIYEIFRP